MGPDKGTLLRLFALMVRSRRYEESLSRIYLEGKTPLFNMANGPIPGEMHLSNGQEPCAVGICAHLTPQDFVTATHRPHHIAIAKGVNLNSMTAEIFGKASGLAGGRGGHMHLLDPAANFACSGIVAQGMGPAAGAALAFRMRGQPHVAVAFIGEGAVNQGAFHEVMNLAALWSLPFICVIEDNEYGISVAKKSSTAVPRNNVRAASYGIPGHYVPDNDPITVYEAGEVAIARARSGKGPSLIEIRTARLEGHFMGDAEAYRPKGEKEKLLTTDPIPRFRARLRESDLCSEKELNALEAEQEEIVSAAIAYARAAADPNPEDALSAVFA